jgi:hypothetical protein
VRSGICTIEEVARIKSDNALAFLNRTANRPTPSPIAGGGADAGTTMTDVRA